MRRLIVIMILAACSTMLRAQEGVSAAKHGVQTNAFVHNWFAETQLAWDLNHSGTARHHATPAVSLGVGKWFTPGIALRTKLHGFSWAHGHGNSGWLLGEQVLLNVTQLLKGYQPDRTWCVIPYFGGGLARNMAHNVNGTTLDIGLRNELRLSGRVALNVELAYSNMTKGVLQGVKAATPGLGAHQRDHHWAVEVGVTWRLGRSTWERVPDVEALRELNQDELDALNAQLEDAQRENERLQQLLEQGKK